MVVVASDTERHCVDRAKSFDDEATHYHVRQQTAHTQRGSSFLMKTLRRVGSGRRSRGSTGSTVASAGSSGSVSSRGSVGSGHVSQAIQDTGGGLKRLNDRKPSMRLNEIPRESRSSLTEEIDRNHRRQRATSMDEPMNAKHPDKMSYTFYCRSAPELMAWITAINGAISEDGLEMVQAARRVMRGVGAGRRGTVVGTALAGLRNTKHTNKRDDGDHSDGDYDDCIIILISSS